MAEATNEKELSDNKKILPEKLSAKSSTIPHNNSRKRRLPQSFSESEKDIYVTHRGSFKAQLNRCEKILKSDGSEITIHALGVAINRACTLAQQLKNNHNGILELDIKISTVELTDDIEPQNDDEEYGVNSRDITAIHIRVFKTIEFGPLKYTKK